MILALLAVILLVQIIGFLHLRLRLKKLDANLHAELKRQRKLLTAATGKKSSSPIETESVSVKLRDGTTVPLSLPATQHRGKDSFFILGLHKTGTTLLNAMMKDLTAVVDVPFVDLPGMLYEKGISYSDVLDSAGLFQQPGVCFGGSRSMAIDGRDFDLLDSHKAVVLVRDPRDILVSHYFSIAGGHKVPTSGNERARMLESRATAAATAVDEWVLERAPKLAANFDGLHRWVAKNGNERTKLFRYEDVIFEKARWLQDISSWFGWQPPTEKLQRIAQRHDIRPGKEAVGHHIRKVSPGDHQEKLKPETIEALNAILSPAAAKFGYHLS